MIIQLGDLMNNIMKCCNCGSISGVELHHIVPLALGGNDIETNKVPLCTKCHELVHHHLWESENSRSELIKIGIAKRKAAGLSQGRTKGKFDKFTPEVRYWCEKYLNKECLQKEVMAQTGLSRNTIKKYCDFIMSEKNQGANI